MSLGVPSPRRFPPPWTVEEQPASFVVRDHSGQALDRLDRTDNDFCEFTAANITLR
jgi:hypothetical protein